MAITTASPPTSILALVTMVHVALLVLRKHRLPAGVFPWALLPSMAFCCAPWLFTSAEGLGLAVLAHVAWFAACERLIPLPTAPSSSPLPPPLTAPTAEVHGQPSRHTATHDATGDARRDFVPLSVLAVIDESPTVRTFRFSRPDSFEFQAGQFLTLRVQVDGQPHVRCYSISSAPEASGYLEVSVKRQGLVSGTLHATVRQGSQVWVRPPAGRFVYPASDDRPLVLIAGGVGITPLMSMVRHAVAADPQRPVTLLYSARTSEELVYRDELLWLSTRHAHLRVGATVTGESEGWSGHRGRISPALLAHHVPDAAHSVFMLCGQADMVRDIREMLATAGVADAQVRFEAFQAATAIGARMPVAPMPAAAPTLELVRSRRTVTVPSGQSLLDAADKAGAPIPSLCRSGVCGTCRTRLLSGDVHCSSDALDARDREAGYVLPCVTWARGDARLEA